MTLVTCIVIPTKILYYSKSKLIIIYHSTYFVYNLTCAKEKVLPFNLFSSSFEIEVKEAVRMDNPPPCPSRIVNNFLLHTFVIVTHVNTLHFYYGTWNLM